MYKCPKCGSTDLRVIVCVKALFVQHNNIEEDISVTVRGAPLWDHESVMQCAVCCHKDYVKKFQTIDE
jgi:hypothetical protein